jgi:hypothetical protein
MRMVRLHSIVMAMLAAWLLLACGVQHTGLSKAQQPGNPPALVGVGLKLPAPATLLSGVDHPRSASAALYRNGSLFVPGAAQLATAEGGNARFSPAWRMVSDKFDLVAFAIYKFNLQGVTESNTVELSWDTPPGDFANLWLGLSRWDNGRWEWFAGPADGTLELGPAGSAPYCSPGTADLFVAVVLLGTTEDVLQQVKLNGKLSPVAELTADPLSGVGPLNISMDAAGSHDPWQHREV